MDNTTKQLRRLMVDAATPDDDGWLDLASLPFCVDGWLGTRFWMVNVSVPEVASNVYGIPVEWWDRTDWDEALNDWWWPSDVQPTWHPKQVVPTVEQVRHVVDLLDDAASDQWVDAERASDGRMIRLSNEDGSADHRFVSAVDEVMPDGATLHSAPNKGARMFGWRFDEQWVGVLMGCTP